MQGAFRDPNPPPGLRSPDPRNPIKACINPAIPTIPGGPMLYHLIECIKGQQETISELKEGVVFLLWGKYSCIGRWWCSDGAGMVQ